MAPIAAAPASARRFTRRRAIVLVLAALVLLASVFSAYADPSPQPSPGPVPAPTASDPAEPTPTPSPSCSSADCIPQPSSPPSPTPSPGVTPPADTPEGGGGPGGISGWIAKGVDAAITGFFKSVISYALNPLLNLLSNTLLTTPNPATLPRVGELWANSWQIAVACYALLIALAGILVMAHGTVQPRTSVKEIAPRIPVAFIAAALSLFLAGKAVELANALSLAALSGGVDSDDAGPVLRNFVLSTYNSSTGSVFLILMWLAIVVVLVALLLTFVVRVALTIILVVAAPLALVCHVLPQTDAVARWWWRVFGGVLAIQVAQSLALITGVKVFLSPGAFGRGGLFGLDDDGLVSVLITLALLYIVFKIPFWILSSVRVSNGHSFVGSVARGFVMYKTFGLLRGGSSAVRSGPRRTAPLPRQASPRPTPGGAPPARNRLRPPGPPLFLPPVPSGPNRATGRAAGPPPMPTFQTPGGSSASGPSSPSPRPLFPPAPPVFQAPGSAPPATTPGTPPPLPTRPRFQPPTLQPRVQPRRAAGPPPPATFRAPASPSAPPRPARSSPPTSAVFIAPPPPRRPRGDRS
ncbi:MAG TPA: hypothetical protein VIU15_27430 [Streptomyces sp.]